MNVTQSRRRFLGVLSAGAAAAVAPAAVAALAPAAEIPLSVPLPAVAMPSPDAALFKLIDDCWAAKALHERAYQAFKPYEETEFEDKKGPGLPDARAGDVELGFRPNDMGWYGGFEVNRMRGEKWYDGDYKNENGMITTRSWEVVPSPAARARADEIIAAYERATGYIPRKPRGYRKAERALKVALNTECAIQRRIQKTPARTIAGVIAKARLAVEGYRGTAVDPDMGMSLVNDLFAMDAPEALS